MDRIPILLDTDAGSDIDDAIALAYLLRQPRCELLGITTVTGEVDKRAAIAEVVCAAAGRTDVPIHLGRRDTLLEGPGQPHVPHYEPISNLPHRMDRLENTAVEFMRRTIRARPCEITLLSIGPMANIALLFALDPEIPYLLKGLVSMAGVFFADGRAEWNVRCDPTAAAMVYRTPRPHHLSIGLDVTEPCVMTRDEVARRFESEPLATVHRMADRWFAVADRITFHDPLAAVAIFHPDLVGTVCGRVVVETHGEAPGATVFMEGPGNDRVAKTVDPSAFFTEFFSVF